VLLNISGGAGNLCPDMGTAAAKKSWERIYSSRKTAGILIEALERISQTVELCTHAKINSLFLSNSDIPEIRVSS
jgi:hypothetical protein